MFGTMGSQGGGIFCGVSACCTVIPMIVINIMMWINMFESDKACGPRLWGYGIVVLVMGVFHGCTTSAGSGKRGQ